MKEPHILIIQYKFEFSVVPFVQSNYFVVPFYLIPHLERINLLHIELLIDVFDANQFMIDPGHILVINHVLIYTMHRSSNITNLSNLFATRRTVGD